MIDSKRRVNAASRCSRRFDARMATPSKVSIHYKKYTTS
jgi:hypothetical protein